MIKDDIKRQTLSCGMDTIVIPREGIDVVTVLLLYRIGSAGERVHEQGMAHFLEHMMFKGSRGYPSGAIDQLTQRAGGENNAFTSRDFTAYLHMLPRNNWLQALAMEKDRMLYLNLDQEEFESERQVVMEELRMYADEPQEVLMDVHQNRIFPVGHPYHHPVIGSLETLRNMTVADMREFYDAWVRTDNCSLLVIGGVEPEEVFSQVKREFGGLRTGSRLTLGTYPVGGQDCQRQVEVFEMDVDSPRIRISWPGPSLGSKDVMPAEFAEEYLAGSRSALLNLILKENQTLVSSVAASSQPAQFGGVFAVEMDVLEDVDLVHILELVEAEIASAGRVECSQDMLERIRTKMESGFIFEQEKTEELAFAISTFLHLGDCRKYLDQLEEVKAVSAADLSRFCRQYLTPESAQIGVVVPFGERESWLERLGEEVS